MNSTESKISFDDFSFICRICLSKGDIQPFTQALQDLFTSFAKISIEDELPKSVCAKCVKQLTEFRDFIDLAIVNDEHLKEVLIKHKDKINLEYFDSDTKFEISEEDSITDHNGDVKDENIFADNDIKGNELISKHQFHCKSCKNIFISFKDLSEHKKQNKDCAFKCENCKEVFSFYKELCTHRKKNESCRDKRHLCSLCGKVFKYGYSLKRHSRAHTNETPFECKLCGKRFKFPQNLRRHTIAHQGVKPFKCNICGKGFSRLERVTKHKSVHSFACGYCGDVFEHRNIYREHLENQHGFDQQQINECLGKHIKLFCMACGTQFKKRSEYYQHLFEHKLNNGENNDRVSKCNICGKLFSSKYALQSHSVVHTGKKEFLCSICGKDFHKKSSMELHGKTHSEERSIECEVCGKKFKQYGTYNIHRRIHTDERLYKCHICSKTFKQSCHLTRHFTTHTGEKKYKCSFCGKSFAEKCNLKTHVRIHTGERPYHCTICKKGFYHASSLEKHKKIHSKELSIS